MALLPVSYSLRSLVGRPSATLLTALGIGATVAVLAGVLALQQGFRQLFTRHGRTDLIVLLRPGSTSEGDSILPRSRTDVLLKTLPEIAEDADGRPLAAREVFLAVRLKKAGGRGETNVPIRGVEPASFALHGRTVEVVEGRRFDPGTDEVLVGSRIASRIEHCRIGDVLVLNTTPFRVVGVFESEGPYGSEIWGDVERMADALERPGFSRIVAQLEPGADVAALAERLERHKEAPALVLTERAYLEQQTGTLSVVLVRVGAFLGVVMGIAAVFTGANTMLAAVASRTYEVGVLLSVGFRPAAIFLAFLLEAALLGVLGGLLGCLLVLPLHGIRTGTTNWDTFTEVAFAFRVTPLVLLVACGTALGIGVVSGTWPALKASLLRPAEALRRV